jgi:hypothetical protein
MITQELRQKFREIALTRDNSKRIASLPKGKKHWKWTDKPSKLTLHRRLHRTIGKASEFPCRDCGKQAFDWSNETGNYTDKIEDYVPRCRSCHIVKDRNYQKKTF